MTVTSFQYSYLLQIDSLPFFNLVLEVLKRLLICVEKWTLMIICKGSDLLSGQRLFLGKTLQKSPYWCTKIKHHMLPIAGETPKSFQPCILKFQEIIRILRRQMKKTNRGNKPDYSCFWQLTGTQFPTSATWQKCLNGEMIKLKPTAATSVDMISHAHRK